MDVFFQGLKGCVTAQFFNLGDCGPTFQGVGDEGVPEIMPSEIVIK
jgi:hypothetical protein